MSALIEGKPLVIIAYSARYIAQSVSRAGYQPIVLDAFGDCDTLDCCELHFEVDFSVPERCGRQVRTHLLEVKRKYGVGYLLIGTGIEYLLDTFDQLAEWEMLNATHKTLKRVFEPETFFPSLDQLDIPYPGTRFSPPNKDQQDWLIKPKYGTGGAKIQHWISGTETHLETYYWQKLIVGMPMSAVFLATPNQTKIIGINTLWVNWGEGGLELRYDGAVSTTDVNKIIKIKIVSYIDKLIKEFNLVGFNSLDFIQDHDEIFVLEVNPRITGTCELYDREDDPFSLVMEHVRACRLQRIRDFEVRDEVNAYQNLYAAYDLSVPLDMHWPAWAKDLPKGGSNIRKGQPICSVHASGDEQIQVSNLLKTRIKELLKILNKREPKS